MADAPFDNIANSVGFCYGVFRLRKPLKIMKTFYVVMETANSNPAMVELVGEQSADDSTKDIKVKGCDEPVKAWVLDEHRFKLLCSKRKDMPFKAYKKVGERYYEITHDDLNPGGHEDLLEVKRRTETSLKRLIDRRIRQHIVRGLPPRGHLAVHTTDIDDR